MPILDRAAVFVSGDSPVGRDATVDVLRGSCIVAMVFAHVALGGIGHRITHFAVWYDGAMGFVLLSGLVVGLVYRKTVDRNGLRASAAKAWKRAGLVYGAHLLLCALGFAIAAVYPARDEVYASFADIGGWWQAILASLALQINPPKAAILSLYVILLLCTPVACYLMRRNTGWVLLGVVGIVFLMGHAWEQITTLPRQPGEFGEINVAAWQALYFLAVICGWHWERTREALDFPLVWTVAAAVTLVTVWYARATSGHDRPELVHWAFASGQMGAGTVVLAFTVVATIYPAVRWLERRLRLLMGILTRIGRRSLDCYVILAFVVLIWQSAAPYDRSSWVGDLGAIGTLTAMWAWSRVRDRRSAPKGVKPELSLGAAVG